jgi:hypothetical protein
VLAENSVIGSGLDFHAAGRYSLSSPPRPCRRRILSVWAGEWDHVRFVFGSTQKHSVALVGAPGIVMSEVDVEYVV